MKACEEIKYKVESAYRFGIYGVDQSINKYLNIKKDSFQYDVLFFLLFDQKLKVEHLHVAKILLKTYLKDNYGVKS